MRSRLLLSWIFYLSVAFVWVVTRPLYAQNVGPNTPPMPGDPNMDTATKAVLDTLKNENAQVPQNGQPAPSPAVHQPGEAGAAVPIRSGGAPMPPFQPNGPSATPPTFPGQPNEAANSSGPPPPPAPPVPPSPSTVTVSPDGFLEIFDYVVGPRRDPFEPPAVESGPGAFSGPLLPLQKWDLDQLKCTTIIWDVARPMAMIRDPKGVVHIVSPNDKIGKNNGYVAVIREGELVIVEPIQNEGRVIFTTKLMKLAR